MRSLEAPKATDGRHTKETQEDIDPQLVSNLRDSCKSSTKETMRIPQTQDEFSKINPPEFAQYVYGTVDAALALVSLSIEKMGNGDNRDTETEKGIYKRSFKSLQTLVSSGTPLDKKGIIDQITEVLRLLDNLRINPAFSNETDNLEDSKKLLSEVKRKLEICPFEYS